MERLGVVLLGVLFFSNVACGGSGSGVPKCIPGDAKACVGPGACAGSQVCQADGTYAACLCGGAAGAAGSQGGSGGAGTGTAGAIGTGGAAGAAGASGAGGQSGAAGSGAGTGGAAGAAGASGAGGQSGAAGSGAGTGGTGGAPPACNEFDQTGCASTERCTWLSLTSTTGRFACVADGTVGRWGACTTGAPGASTGFDNCQRGLACYEGLCQPICSIDINLVCDPPESCTMSASLFYSNGSNADYAGVCAPTCNPLTQVRDYDQAPACGSPTPATPTFGCYGLPGGVFTCQTVLYPNNTSDASATGFDPSMPLANANTCAPGYEPLLPAQSRSSQIICAALCQPAPTSSTATTQAGGVSPYTCAAAGAGGTHECRYWWYLENRSNSFLFPDALSNTLGYCIDYTQYTYPGSTPTPAPQPSCTTLSATAHIYDGILTDAQYWGCQPYPSK